MQTFDKWYSELTSDERWFEQAGLNHKPETFKDVALKVYTNGMTDSLEFANTPMKFHRQHVFNKLCKILPDRVKKPWYMPKEEPKEPAIQLSEEEIQRRLAEWKESVRNAPIMKPSPPLTAKERIQGEEWRPKPEAIREPSELEKRKAYRDHYDTVRLARTRTFTDAYPDADEAEILAYLDQYKKIDDPLNLF